MQDFVYAFRFLKKRWGVATVAAVVMGLGISLTATVYAIIDGVVLSGPDYPDLDELIALQTTIPKSEFHQNTRIHDYLDWREQQSVFEEMGAYLELSANLSGDESRAENYAAARVTASIFDVLDRRPFMGRAFTAEDDRDTERSSVILSYDLWVDRFESDPGVLGRTIRVDARPATVVGVMPVGFHFPEVADLWLPLAVDEREIERGEGPGLEVVARLADGATEEEARTQLTAIAARLEQQYPEANEDIVPVVSSWMEEEVTNPETKVILFTMLIAVIGVLLIACANVANLLFAVTIGRSKELAVRTAMGARRRRVLLQLLNETLVLAVLGSTLGLVLSKFSLDLLTRLIVPLNPPSWMKFELSPPVLLFAIGITFLAALVSGFLPAVYATRADVNSLLQDQSRGTSSRSVSRWSTALVSVEVSLSFALLVSAGLMTRSTLNVGRADHGVETAGILTAGVLVPEATYGDSIAVVQVLEELKSGAEALPGASDVALASGLPGIGTGLYFYGIEDRQYNDDSEYSFSGYTRVTPEFFEILGVEIVAGRNFDANDRIGTERVIIVDRRFAELNWPDQDPLGKRVRLGRSDSENPWMTVVGLVENIGMLEPFSFQGRKPEGMFAPMAQHPVLAPSILVRTAGDPLASTTALRNMVDAVDRDIPVRRMATLDKRIADANLDTLIIGGMFTVFGAVALLLASIGLYAVMAFSVSRRTTEVGVRMAMGADGRTIIRLVLRQGAKPVVIGLGVGVLLALGLGRALAQFLFDVSPTDPATFVGVPVILTLVSVAALLIPANRASRIAPVVALRED